MPNALLPGYGVQGQSMSGSNALLSSIFNSPSALQNLGINIGSLFGPPGTGLAAGFGQGLYNSYAYPGDTYQSQSGLAGMLNPTGPGFGAQLFNWLFGPGGGQGGQANSSMYGMPGMTQGMTSGISPVTVTPQVQYGGQNGVTNPGFSNLGAYQGNMYMMGDSGFGPGIAGNMGGYSGGFGSLGSTVSGGTTGYLSGEGGGDMAQGKQSVGGTKSL